MRMKCQELNAARYGVAVGLPRPVILFRRSAAPVPLEFSDSSDEQGDNFPKSLAA